MNVKFECKNVVDKKFWKTAKTFLTGQVVSKKKYLIVQDRMIPDDSETAEVFNDYLSNLVPDLELKIRNALIFHNLKNKDQ